MLKFSDIFRIAASSTSADIVLGAKRIARATVSYGAAGSFFLQASCHLRMESRTRLRPGSALSLRPGNSHLPTCHRRKLRCFWNQNTSVSFYLHLLRSSQELAVLRIRSFRLSCRGARACDWSWGPVWRRQRRREVPTRIAPRSFSCRHTPIARGSHRDRAPV